VRFGLLTQWYDPEPGPAALPGVLARGLVGRGHDVSVLTGFPNYPTGRLAPGYRVRRRVTETLDHVSVTRVALYPSHDASFLRRSANYASFGASALVNGLSALRDLDALWVNYSPITIAPAMWAAKAAYGVPLIVHVGDLWPDTLTAGGFAPRGRAGRALDATLHRWCEAMYAAATTVTYISPGVRDVLHARGVPEAKLAYLPMWAQEERFAPIEPAEQERLSLRAELGYDEHAVVLLYAGALGEAQGLGTLLEALAQLPPEATLRVLIAGSGIAEESLRRQAAGLGLLPERVHFLGRVPEDRMPALMSTADACYVGLRSDPLSRLTMPSKTQAILASAKALVVAADGDVQQVVRDAGSGLAVDSGDVAGLAGALQATLARGRGGLREDGARGRDYYQATFSVAHGVARTEELLMHAARTRPAKARR
jgi:colanic acid biosynthesis glycosyl transferase WcaI